MGQIVQIKILKTDDRLGVKAGEIYDAKPYTYDPQSKWELIGRVPDGYDPSCTQYKSEVRCLNTEPNAV